MQPSSQKGPGTALECETSKERRQAAPKLDPLGWRCGSGDVTNLRWKEVKRSERVRSKEVEVAEAATTSKMVSWCIGPTTLKHAGRSTSWGLGITHLSFELFPSPFCATAVERGFATAFDMQTDSLGHQRRQKECSLDQSGTASILTSYLSTWPRRKQASVYNLPDAPDAGSWLLAKANSIRSYQRSQLQEVPAKPVHLRATAYTSRLPSSWCSPLLSEVPTIQKIYTK